jgi:alpha-N-arabinofuranosidase
MKRREFLQAAAGLAFAYKFARLGVAQSMDAHIEIFPDEKLGTISPNIYGHFVENLSGVIYDGIWVGENSKIANINGIRKALVDEMRKIKPALVRFPGGCFADSYDWRDGVGPVEKRPRRTNFWAGGEKPGAPDAHRYDPNRFGTNEFVAFCRLLSAQPYLAANLRSLPAQEFYRWVEYCNSPAGSTTLADERAAAGFKEPFDVRYWGVGNESWGCGGNFTPQEYAAEFRRYTAWVPGYGGDLKFVAAGPDGGNQDWTSGFFETIAHKSKGLFRGIYGWALHHYAWNLSRGRTNDWNAGKGDALNFDAVDWYELLREGDRMESMINTHWKIMGETDSDHHVKLVVDEWGPWYRPGSALTPTNQLEQLPTLRDAVFSGMTLDTFNRHPEKVGAACCAQLINCLNSLYMAHEDNFCVTPVGHVFAMYAAHQGGQSLRAEFESPAVDYDRDGKSASFWRMRGSASLHEKTLVLTAVNTSVRDPIETQVLVHGAQISAGEGLVLTHADLQAHNTFQDRESVVPKTVKLEIKNGSAILRLPASSVVRLQLQLA